MTDPKTFRRPVSSNQWKFDLVNDGEQTLDFEEEFQENVDPTTEFLITEPDDYMDELELEDEITEVYAREDE